jgi:4-amino-4-deoxy-L-arabinose transferase-like glycosyltransferase
MRRVGVAVFLCAAAVILLWDLGALNITIMEARNFVTAREMVEDGSYLIPTLNGEYRLQKPPLPTWLTAFVVSVTDMKSVFWLRIPAVLFGLMALWYTMKIFRMFEQQQRDTTLTGAVLLTSFYFFLTSRSGMWDIFAQAFMIGGIYYYIQYWRNEKRSVSAAILFSVFCAGSFMSKGPVAFYSLFIPCILAYHIFFRPNQKDIKKKVIGSIFGLLMALTLAALWPLYIHFSDAGQAAAEILKKEAGNWSSYNVRPFYYYWSFPIQSGVWTIYGFLGLLSYILFYNQFKNNKILKLYFWWTILVFILLSVVPEKKSRYLLPILFPMAMFVSEAIQSTEFPKLQKIMQIATVITSLVLMLAGVILMFDLRPEVSQLYARISGGAIILMGGMTSFYLALKQKLPISTYVISAVVGVFILFFIKSSGDLMDSTNAVNSFHRFDTEESLQNLNLYSIGDMRPELVWNLGRKAPRIKSVDQVNDHDVIGVFSTTKLVNQPDINVLDSWEIISEEVFDQNPIQSAKRPNVALKRYFTKLRKIQ